MANREPATIDDADKARLNRAADGLDKAGSMLNGGGRPDDGKSAANGKVQAPEGAKNGAMNGSAEPATSAASDDPAAAAAARTANAKSAGAASESPAKAK
jgi:hypothetical protein